MCVRPRRFFLGSGLTPLCALCSGLLQVVKARIKELLIPRYKIVVLISIGQLGDQSMYVGSRCLWDVANDTFAMHTFKNSSLLAMASVYAVYFE